MVRLTFAALLPVFAALFVSAASVSAAPLDLGFSSATPYDGYLKPVRNVLGQLNGTRASEDQVRQLVREGRRFRYSYTDPYVASAPEKTEARRAGDCKDKALWLADRLNDPSVRFVIGKARANSRISHAWLYWKDDTGRWWILDPTNNYEPIAQDRVSQKQYIPLYSFAKNGSYRHSTSSTRTASAVAGRRAAVASR